jgi:hypothetical protein
MPAGRPKGATNKSARELKAACQAVGGHILDGLLKIFDDAKLAPEARIEAGEAILNRGYGKPAQQVRHNGAVGAYDFARLPDEQLRIVYDGLKAAAVDGLGDVDA